MSGTTSLMTWHHVPEYWNLQQHTHLNTKSCICRSVLNVFVLTAFLLHQYESRKSFFLKVKVVPYYLLDPHNFEECTQNIKQYYQEMTVWHLHWWYIHHRSCTSNQSTIRSKAISDDTPLDRIYCSYTCYRE